MGGGIRSNVKSYLTKRLTLSRPRPAPAPAPADDDDDDDIVELDTKPQHHLSSSPETSVASYGPSLSILSSKDHMDVSSTSANNNGKETSESLLNKRKFETSGLEELSEKIEYLNGFAPAYRDQTPTDILLYATGDSISSPSIPAHKLLLASRSRILTSIASSYGLEASVNQMDSITFPELNHGELESLVDFLYNADLPEEKMAKHVYSLYVAANKYGISYLEKLCVRHMLRSLSSANALDVLEFADANSCPALKDNVMDYITKNMTEVVFSAQFEALELKNPNLCVQISRASIRELVKMQNTATSRQK